MAGALGHREQGGADQRRRAPRGQGALGARAVEVAGPGRGHRLARRGDRDRVGEAGRGAGLGRDGTSAQPETGPDEVIRRISAARNEEQVRHERNGHKKGEDNERAQVLKNPLSPALQHPRVLPSLPDGLLGSTAVNTLHRRGM